MPSVDIPTSSNGGEAGSKQGFGTGLPTPVLLAAVGGGIGLVVFLMKKQGGSSGSVGTGPNQNTLLPNTAIMLGSLQDSLLNLQGSVTTGNADLSSQLTGVGETLGTQIDSQSAMIQKGFADMSTYMGSSLSTVQGEEDSLASAIAGLGTQNASLADSMTAAMNNLFGIESQLTQANNAIEAVGAGTSSFLTTMNAQQQAAAQSQYTSLLGTIQNLTSQQNAIQSQLTALGVSLTPPASPQIYALAPLNRQAQEVQNNYAKSGLSYDQQNANFLSDYSHNPYHGGYITGTGAWAPLVMAGPNY